MKHIFHPIVGDTTHGDGKHNQLFREQFEISRLLLMATELEFQHPYTQQKLTINAAPEPEVCLLFESWVGQVVEGSLGHSLRMPCLDLIYFML